MHNGYGRGDASDLFTESDASASSHQPSSINSSHPPKTENMDD
jgi:hypothetical protein